MNQAKCKKYDLSGSELEEVTVSYTESKANTQSIKDYIVAMRRNARQWSANTKTRREVNHSNAKPHAQKGTGKARQGTLASPQYKGGGRVHTPKPKFNQHVRINQKERRAAIHALLVNMVNEGNVIFLDDKFEKYFSTPKTKSMNNFLKTIGWDKARVACLDDVEEVNAERVNFKKSIRNIPNTSYLMAENVNGYDLMVSHKIIVVGSAKDQFEALLRGSDAKK